MAKYPVFLLPKNEIMMTASVQENKIVMLQRTLFPSGKKYAISDKGIAVCIDHEKNFIIYGKLLYNGKMEYLKALPFPDSFIPLAMCFVGDNIVFGGKSTYSENNEGLSYQQLMSYSFDTGVYTTITSPFKDKDKSIDEVFLFDDYRLIAVDDVLYPKYLLEYDLRCKVKPLLIKTHQLPENGTNEKIEKGCFNNNYLALKSMVSSSNGSGTFINIFKKGDYKNYIRLSQWYGVDYDGNEERGLYSWEDIYLVPDRNILLISAYSEGVGIYFINADEMTSEYNEDANCIFYYHPWGEQVVKILPDPCNKENVVILFKEYDNKDEERNPSQIVISIDELLIDYNGEIFPEDIEEFDTDYNL